MDLNAGRIELALHCAKTLRERMESTTLVNAKSNNPSTPEKIVENTRVLLCEDLEQKVNLTLSEAQEMVMAYVIENSDWDRLVDAEFLQMMAA